MAPQVDASLLPGAQESALLLETPARMRLLKARVTTAAST